MTNNLFHGDDSTKNSPQKQTQSFYQSSNLKGVCRYGTLQYRKPYKKFLGNDFVSYRSLNSNVTNSATQPASHEFDSSVFTVNHQRESPEYGYDMYEDEEESSLVDSLSRPMNVYNALNYEDFRSSDTESGEQFMASTYAKANVRIMDQASNDCKIERRRNISTNNWDQNYTFGMSQGNQSEEVYGLPPLPHPTPFDIQPDNTQMETPTRSTQKLSERPLKSTRSMHQYIESKYQNKQVRQEQAKSTNTYDRHAQILSIQQSQNANERLANATITPQTIASNSGFQASSNRSKKFLQLKEEPCEISSQASKQQQLNGKPGKSSSKNPGSTSQKITQNEHSSTQHHITSIPSQLHVTSGGVQSRSHSLTSGEPLRVSITVQSNQAIDGIATELVNKASTHSMPEGEHEAMILITSENKSPTHVISDEKHSQKSKNGMHKIYEEQEQLISKESVQLLGSQRSEDRSRSRKSSKAREKERSSKQLSEVRKQEQQQQQQQEEEMYSENDIRSDRSTESRNQQVVSEKLLLSDQEPSNLSRRSQDQQLSLSMHDRSSARKQRISPLKIGSEEKSQLSQPEHRFQFDRSLHSDPKSATREMLGQGASQFANQPSQMSPYADYEIEEEAERSRTKSPEYMPKDAMWSEDRQERLNTDPSMKRDTGSHGTLSGKSYSQFNANKPTSTASMKKMVTLDFVKLEEQNDYMPLIFQLPDGTRTKFIIRRNSPLRNAITAFCARVGVSSPYALSFTNSAGEELNRTITPEMLDMQKGAIIFVNRRN